MLAGGAVVSLVIHNNAVSSVSNDCPRTVCPTNLQSDYNDLVSRAYDRRAGDGLGAGAVVAVGVGTYLLLSGGSRKRRQPR